MCLFACWLVTFVSPAKTAEPIEMPFGGGGVPSKKINDGISAMLQPTALQLNFQP